MSGWAEIPGHLLELIAEKGNGFEFIGAFGLVCRQWRAVAVECKENFMKKQTPQLPWLMLPPKKGSHLRDFYNLTRRRKHQIPSWEFDGKKCYSSRGWLLTVGSDWGMDLLHPMILARFKLPGIKSFDKSSYDGLGKPYAQFIRRAILSACPLTSNFVLMIMYSWPTRAAYWRPRDKRWTLMEILKDKGSFFEALYLVIIEGYLLLVSREGPQCLREEKEFQERPYETINFQVFKLDFKSLNWEELKSLGNWSLFLGHNSSTALDASVVKGCKPNSIYFTDDNLEFGPSTKKGMSFDMGIFNMADRTIKPIIEEDLRNPVSPPIFVNMTF